MYKNVGSKCMNLAKFVCVLGIIGSAVYGIVLIVLGADARGDQQVSLILSGLLVMILGSVASWLSSLGLYAIGEAAENSAIAANLAVKADMERQKENIQMNPAATGTVRQEFYQ